MTAPITITDDREIIIVSHNRMKGRGWTPRNLPDWSPVDVDWTVEFEIEEKHHKPFRANPATRILPRLPFRQHRGYAYSVMRMPLCWIDGEGANVIGPPVIVGAKHGLPSRTYADQNYNYLNIRYESPPTPGAPIYRYLVAKDVDGNETDNGRLESHTILSWLCSLPPRFAYVGFYLEYDIEMWLRDLEPSYRDELAEKHQVHWHGFFIKYIPGTSFRVIRDRVEDSSKKSPTAPKRKLKRNRDRKWFKCWDMYKFFQMSFMEALKDWQLGTPEELAIIQAGKDGRADFSRVDAEVRRYAREESELGIAAIVRVRDVCNRLGLQLSGFHGAGAVADALFRRSGVSELPPVFQPPPLEVVLRSYFGGRFDTSAIGFIGNATEYDINSAYPNRIRNLPCPSHSTWEYTQNYVEDDYSLWYVRWNLSPSELWSPFPFRTRTGDIRYFRNGEGWYYGCEVRAARKLCSDIQILEGYQFICKCSDRPFKWIEDVYTERKVLKATGNLAEKMLKLGMNAGYGKLAETKTPRPVFQNMLYAGIITAMTRAQLMEAVALDPEAVVALATDAVITTRKLPLDVSPSELRKWEELDVEDVLILQNGLYHSPTINPKTGKPLMNGSRGFRHLDWSVVREKFRNGETEMLVPSHSFLTYVKGINSSSTQRRICHWYDEWKKLDFWGVLKLKDYRDGRLYPMENTDSHPSYRDNFKTVVPLTNDYDGALELISEIHTPPDPHDEPLLDITIDPPIIITSHRKLIIMEDD